MTEDKEYYLPDESGEEPVGPFSFADLAAQLKSGKLRAEQYVWASDFPDSQWKQFFEVEEFRAVLSQRPKAPTPKMRTKGISNQRKSLKVDYGRKVGEYGSENLYRRYPRVKLGAEAIIHNQDKIVKGECLDISEKGIFVKSDAMDHFQKGDEVVVTIRHRGELGTFSATSVVLRVVTERDPKGYGFYFMRINPKVRRKIAHFVRKELETYLGVKSA